MPGLLKSGMCHFSFLGNTLDKRAISVYSSIKHRNEESR